MIQSSRDPFVSKLCNDGKAFGLFVSANFRTSSKSCNIGLLVLVDLCSAVRVFCLHLCCFSHESLIIVVNVVPVITELLFFVSTNAMYFLTVVFLYSELSYDLSTRCHLQAGNWLIDTSSPEWRLPFRPLHCSEWREGGEYTIVNSCHAALAEDQMRFAIC